LVGSDNWPYFTEYVFGSSAGEYYRHSVGWQSRALRAVSTPWPWGLVHLVAVPVAVVWVVRSFVAPPTEPVIRSALLGLFYLAWLFQANGIQRQLPYHLVPAVLLALTVLVRQALLSPRPTKWGIALAGVVLWAAIGHPLLTPSRLALWGRCWAEGSSAPIRDALALEPNSSLVPTHVELEAVADYLRRQQVADRELTCYNLSTLSLYPALRVAPSTRFVQMSEYPTMFRLQSKIRASWRPVHSVSLSGLLRGAPPAEDRGPVTVSARLADEYPFLREPVGSSRRSLRCSPHPLLRGAERFSTEHGASTYSGKRGCNA
jgi:hypothetical protein